MNQKLELFFEIEKHLLEDEKPSIFFNELIHFDLFKNGFPFIMLSKLTEIEQSPIHHPEGNVWNHTLLVVDQAALRREQSQDTHIFMWSALLHDIGKATTTKIKKGKITSYDHDKAGENLASNFLNVFSKDELFIDKVCQMVRWHMQILYIVNNLPFAEIKKMKDQVSIDELALLILCDRLGRGGEIDIRKEEEEIKNFTLKCRIR
jgi:tRNA nucleotidyltransferase (CCA-adding enzyme)